MAERTATMPYVTLLYARMESARRRGRGVRLSIEDLEHMHAETVGEWMSAALEEVSPTPSLALTASAIEGGTEP